MLYPEINLEKYLFVSTAKVKFFSFSLLPLYQLPKVNLFSSISPTLRISECCTAITILSKIFVDNALISPDVTEVLTASMISFGEIQIVIFNIVTFHNSIMSSLKGESEWSLF